MTEGVKFHPKRFFTIKSFINFQTCRCYEINIIRTRILIICDNTKMNVFVQNLGCKVLPKMDRKFIGKTRKGANREKIEKQCS